ncbi:hypothetical protein SEA_PUPPER_222 [Gordonia phage Pupper]|uniref:Uncharacterized protein n=1 Tax=Gordonia phage Pupper TaxID=2571249 RepID=A0A4Y6EJ00_9CAUD|nr:hypothetical protein KHQ83_gp055 [Gordonia phage Pupper]QDF18708.1 hypothetical protein SEA_PUPPER_222 [Gordonia phage Pupper]
MSFDNPDPGFLENITEDPAPARLMRIDSGDPDQVEQVAQVFHDGITGGAVEWEDEPLADQAFYRQQAHAVLVSLATYPKGVNWMGFQLVEDRTLPPGVAIVAPERCPRCDDTGDVHRMDGEWLGECHCPAGQEIKGRPTDAEIQAAINVLDRLWPPEKDSQGRPATLRCVSSNDLRRELSTYEEEW